MNKFSIDSNKFLFDPAKPKIGHNLHVRKISSLVSMARKDQKQCQTSIFDLTVSKIRQEQKIPQCALSHHLMK